MLHMNGISDQELCNRLELWPGAKNYTIVQPAIVVTWVREFCHSRNLWSEAVYTSWLQLLTKIKDHVKSVIVNWSRSCVACRSCKQWSGAFVTKDPDLYNRLYCSYNLWSEVVY
jgi:hypothetical protein